MYKISINDSLRSQEELISTFPKLEIWENLPEGAIQTITDLRKTPTGYWLACNGIGAIEIDCKNKQILAYPAKETSEEEFNYFLIHNWLPLAYQAGGSQVIHASAVAHLESHKIILFCGESGSGKSTMAFGLGQRPSWHQIADDRLAFTVSNGSAIPLFIPDSVKLRPASASHFNQIAFNYNNLSWIQKELDITTVFFLERIPLEEKKGMPPFSIHPIKRTEAYPLLLKQAFSLAPGLQELKKTIIQDYLSLANQLNSNIVRFQSEFDILEALFDHLEAVYI